LEKKVILWNNKMHMIQKITRITFLLTCLSAPFLSMAQFQDARIVIQDNIGFPGIQEEGRRSAAQPTSCVTDTVEYARFKASSLQTVSAYEGRGLGQFYGAPQKLTLSGATFYAFVISNPPTALTTRVFVNVYRTNSDSLPVGAPLRSDTLTIDSTFGNGVLTNIVKHAKFNPIEIDFDYIIAVETDINDTLRVGVVANDWNNGDGRGNYFNCGSISGVWYRGRNLNIGTVNFNADMLINPHVSYKLGADFTIVSQCFSIGDSVKFINKNKENISSSIFYNRYSFNNQDLFSHRWNYDLVGTPFNSFATVDGQTSYFQSQPYQVRLISSVLQWTNARFCYDTVVQTVYPKPIPPTIQGGGIKCAGDDADLFVNKPSGTTVRWHLNDKDTTGFFVGDTYTAKQLTKDTFIYARISNGLCLSNAGSAAMSVFPYPSVPVVKNDSICAGSRATLIAVSPGSLNINWFRDSSANFPFFTGNIYQTPILNADTFFFVRASNFNCFSTGFVKVRALVGQDFAPIEPDYVGDTSVCAGTNPLVTLTASTQSQDLIRWFDQSGTGNPIATGTTYSFSPTQKGTYNFFVETWNGSCGSSRVLATVIVDDAPVPSLLQAAEICAGGSTQLRAVVPFGKIDWFDNATGGNSLLTGTTFNLFNLKQDSSLWIETSSGACIAKNRIKLTAVVNTPPTFAYLTGDTICSRGIATLKAGVPYGEILWYDKLSDTASIGFGNFYTTTTPQLGEREFYAAGRFKGCVGPKSTVRTTVRPRPFSGFFNDVLSNQRVQFTPLTTSGSSYNWNFGDGNISSQTAPQHQYADTGRYNVRLILTSISNGCKDTTTNEVVIPWIDRTNVNSISCLPPSIYPNPSASQYFIIEGFSSLEAVEAWDMQGRLIQHLNAQEISYNTFRIEHNLSAGFYFIKAGNYLGKLIVE